MLELTCNIIITSADKSREVLVFKYANEVSIESSWKCITDNCSIKLPRKLKLKDKRLDQLIKKSDAVTVNIGYNGTNRTEFRGYISDIKPTTPITIECEDEMYTLKRMNIIKSWKSAKLIDVVKEIWKGPIKCFDADLGAFTINKLNGVQALELIKDVYGLVSFFREINGVNTLVTGFIYDPDVAQTYNYHFQKNIIKNDLEFKTADEVKLKVKVISTFPDGKHIEIELGDKDGQERTLNFFNLQKAELEKLAKIEILKLRFDGYRGKFTAFGIPNADDGDIVSLTDDLYPERAGKYYIDKVVKTWGMGGFRREITLGPKASAV